MSYIPFSDLFTLSQVLCIRPDAQAGRASQGLSWLTGFC